MNNEVQAVETVTEVTESVARAPMSAKQKGILLAAAILTGGLAVGGFFLGRHLYRRHQAAKKASQAENSPESHE